jgi:transcriptional regulator with XRE-family HTH domain
MAADIRARFGVRLRSLRKRRGWTQVELADYLGLRRTYISDLERGKRNVSLVTLQIIARGFELSVSKLLSRI